MAQFVFPAVLYKDEEGNGFTIVLHDIDVFTEGQTVEEAFLRAKSYLLTYCRCALDYNGEIPEATPYVKVSVRDNNIVLLVDTEFGEAGIRKEAFNL